MCYKQKCKVVSLNLAHPVGEADVILIWGGQVFANVQTFIVR